MTRPEIIFHIQNYHYETRTRTVRYKDSDGNSHTRYETYTERVNTHRASEHFYYQQWTDTSADALSLSYISEFLVTRLRFYKTFSFTTCARQSYNEQLHDFKYHNIRDTHHDFWVNEEIPGFRSNVLIYNDVKGPIPWFAKRSWFLLLMFFMLSWVQRITFVR